MRRHSPMSPSHPISPSLPVETMWLGVELLDEFRRAGDPGEEAFLVVIREGPRLVGDLPGEDGRVFPVGASRITVRTGDDVAYVFFQQYFTTVGGLCFVELPHVSHEGVPSGQSRNGIGAPAAPFEVLAVSAAPFPGIGEVEHCLHVPLSQFGHQEIQPVECAVVVNSGCGLQDRFDFRYDSRVAFRPDQDTQVADTRCLQPVEFAAQAVTVAPRPFGGQQSPVPKVGSDEIA